MPEVPDDMDLIRRERRLEKKMGISPFATKEDKFPYQPHPTAKTHWTTRGIQGLNLPEFTIDYPPLVNIDNYFKNTLSRCFGFDGTNWRGLSVETDGSLNVNLTLADTITVNQGLANATENWRMNLTQVGGAAIALGQAAMAASLPVAIASDQSNVPTNLVQVGGAAIALGSTTLSASVPVALASDEWQFTDASPLNSFTAVAVTSTTILAANSSRSYASIVNDSDTVVYLAIEGGTAVVGSGLRINANGGSFEINKMNLMTGAVAGIHGGTGTKNVAKTELD